MMPAPEIETIEIICRFTLSIGLVGSQEEELEVEVPANFHSLPADKQQDLLDEVWKDWAWNFIDGGCSAIES